MSDKIRGALVRAPFEVDAASKAARVIVYQADGRSTSVAEAHGGVIAINPMIEPSASTLGRLNIWTILNLTQQRISINSLQFSVTTDSLFGPSAATVQRYDLMKHGKQDRLGTISFQTNGRFSSGTPKRTATSGLVQPGPSRSGGASTFYDGGVGPIIMMWDFATGGWGIGTTGKIFWSGVGGRVGQTTTIYSNTDFVIPGSPVTFLDWGEALSLFTTSPTNAIDQILGTCQYSIDGDPARGIQVG